MKGFLLGIGIFCLGASEAVFSQSIAKLTVRDINESIETPVNIDLDGISDLQDSLLVLQRIVGNKKIPVPFQVEHGYHRFLWWTVSGGTAADQQTQVFELSKGKAPQSADPSIVLQDEDGDLVLSEAGKKIIQYNYKTVYPPKGLDSVYRRSGFIHPLWSPSGHELTRRNPPDHPHHVGIWNPWTEVSFEGKTVDFWNLVKKEGTVRFSKFVSKTEGPIYSGFEALQEHIVYGDTTQKTEKVAMNEVWDVRVYNIGTKMWLWDFTSSLNCATTEPVILKAYRYAGFGFRATPDWNNQNSKVLTSAGKTRKDADSSRARWCMIDGDVGGGHSGVLFMGHPANYNFPEPMRIWRENMNGRGDVFFNFCPTRNMDWTLTPGNRYVLKYRLLVYDGTITPALAEKTWNGFAHPPEVIITKFSYQGIKSEPIPRHPSKSLENSPGNAKPAATDSSSKKIDTGPSEFFDGASINVKYPDAGMQKLYMSGRVCVVEIKLH
jgi:hypothetical protein